MHFFPFDSWISIGDSAAVDRFNKIWPVFAVILVISLIFSLLPLGTALQFGGDEGYELMKGLLVSKGFKLYKDIWNDQPPVFTLLLASAFKAWGPSIFTARLIAGAFGLTLFGIFFQLVYGRNGRWAALLATFLLLASPTVLELSVSVMKEVPAFAIALVSALLLFRWRKHPHWSWLLSSGVVMGTALGIKVSAVLIAPAMLLEIALTFQSQKNQPWLKQSLVAGFQWATAAALVFGMINVLWGQGSATSSWKAHFEDRAVAGFPSPDDFPMQISMFLEHSECTIAAIIGLIAIAKTKKYREFAFPTMFLLTALVIHAIYRPWWMYYYLHVVIPMAWLAGGAASVALLRGWQHIAKTRFNLYSKKTWIGVGISVIALLAFVRSEGRLESEVKDLRHRQNVKSSAILAKMEEHAYDTHWVYVPLGQQFYPFHAQLSMPPELAVVTLKRLWSGQISEKQIIEICRKYKPEQVLVDRGSTSAEWLPFLENYTVICRERQFDLYLKK